MELGDLYSIPASVSIINALSLFKDREIEIIKEVTLALKDKTATALKNLTHKEDAWIKTAPALKIDYKHAENLLLF